MSIKVIIPRCSVEKKNLDKIDTLAVFHTNCQLRLLWCLPSSRYDKNATSSSEHELLTTNRNIYNHKHR